MLTTDQKGAIAELAIARAAAQLGVGVFKPLTDGERYDLIFDLHPRLLRVQCKWASRRGDVVVISCRTSRRSSNGFVRRSYTRNEVDAIAAYSAELDRCFLVLVERLDGRPGIHLRLSPTRNNQHTRINWADDFDFDARLGALVGP